MQINRRAHLDSLFSATFVRNARLIAFAFPLLFSSGLYAFHQSFDWIVWFAVSFRNYFLVVPMALMILAVGASYFLRDYLEINDQYGLPPRNIGVVLNDLIRSKRKSRVACYLYLCVDMFVHFLLASAISYVFLMLL